MSFIRESSNPKSGKIYPPLPPRPSSSGTIPKHPPPVPPRNTWTPRTVNYSNDSIGHHSAALPRSASTVSSVVQKGDFMRQKSAGFSTNSSRTSSVMNIVQHFQTLTQNETRSEMYSNIGKEKLQQSYTIHTNEPIYEEIPAMYESPVDSCSTATESYWSDSTFDSNSADEGDDLTPLQIHEEIDHPLDSKQPLTTAEELQQNEHKYIENLMHGIVNYIPLIYRPNVPEGLRGQKNNLFGNIEAIQELHQDELLPNLQRCYRNADQIADCLLHFVDTDKFYCYVHYALNRKKANMMFDMHAEYFASCKHELNSFLLQPIQRLPRYKLFMDKFLKETLEFGDDHYTADRISKIRRAKQGLNEINDLVNAAVCISDIPQCSEEFIASSPPRLSPASGFNDDMPATLILRPKGNKSTTRNNPIDLFSQGKFRRMIDVDIYDGNQRRWYKARFFMFDKLILYVEILKNKLQYRGHYFDTEINYREGTKFWLFCIHPGTQEIQVQSKDQASFNDFVNSIKIIRRNAITNFFTESQQNVGTGSEEIIKIPRDQHACHSINFDSHITALKSIQMQLCQALEANYYFYIGSLSFTKMFQLQSFTEIFVRMMRLHRERVLSDLSSSFETIDLICDTFLQYVKTDFPAVYCDYLREFRIVAKVITLHQTPASCNSLVVATVDAFTELCINHLHEFVRFFESMTAYLSEKSTRSLDIDSALFQRIAIVQVEMDKYARSVDENYKLFCLDDGLVSYGLVLTSEMVKVQTLLGHSSCRIFVCEKASICVSVQTTENHQTSDRPTERFDSIMFVDKFSGRDHPMRLKNSKKPDGRMNFVISGIKYKIRFHSCHIKDRFYAQYIQQYVLVK